MTNKERIKKYLESVIRINQKARILKYLMDFGKITAMDAFNDLGITQLHTQIHNIRKKGIVVIGTPIVCKNRYGEKVLFHEYSLPVED